MKILMIGDIFGRSGREAIAKYVPLLRQKYQLDFVIANADNASHGAGITTATVKELYGYGVDLLTGGDHVWNQKDILTHIDRSPWILRPLNFSKDLPGKGFHILETPDKRTLLVAHALGRVFIDNLTDNPFTALEALCDRYPLGKSINAILIDFHAEATSEKNAMGHVLDGRVSAVLGTHTHMPTADARILPGGTAYMTDLGMTGDYNSVIGSQKDVPISMFRTGLRLSRFQPAEGEATFCAAYIETDDMTGMALRITPIKLGGVIGTDSLTLEESHNTR